MISGLGCAAELVSKNLKFYQENMREMRDLLEQLLTVCTLTQNSNKSDIVLTSKLVSMICSDMI